MTYFHLSYDIGQSNSERSADVNCSLINLIEGKLLGVITNRPVASTLLFYSQLDFDLIRTELFKWSKEKDVFYVVSQIAESADASPLCRLVANKSLEDGLKSMLGLAHQNKVSQT